MEVVEVNTSFIFDEPIHLNKEFWHGGNNFYIYPLLFGFKKGVVKYSSTNEYIQKNLSQIYTVKNILNNLKIWMK